MHLRCGSTKVRCRTVRLRGCSLTQNGLTASHGHPGRSMARPSYSARIVNTGMKISELLLGKLKPIRRPKSLQRLRPLRGGGFQQPRKLSFPPPPNRP
jgi:hypothetical protein